jgi:hypothetical protein
MEPSSLGLAQPSAGGLFQLSPIGPPPEPYPGRDRGKHRPGMPEATSPLSR